MARWLAIDHGSKRIGLAVGGTKEMAPSVILFTPDFGRSWFPCDVEAAGRLYDIDAPGVGLGFLYIW